MKRRTGDGHIPDTIITSDTHSAGFSSLSLLTLHMRSYIDKRSKYTEENQLTHSAMQTVAKTIDSQGSSYRSLAKRLSKTKT